MRRPGLVRPCRHFWFRANSCRKGLRPGSHPRQPLSHPQRCQLQLSWIIPIRGAQQLGSTVTVLLREDDEAFDLTPEEEAELLESISEMERGEFVSGEDLLERLRRFD
jgi:hypothetical protein